MFKMLEEVEKMKNFNGQILNSRIVVFKKYLQEILCFLLVSLFFQGYCYDNSFFTKGIGSI